MMCLASNKSKMKYSSFVGNSPRYDTDDEWNPIYYETDEGERIYSESGENMPYYTEPKEMYANIAESGGEAEAKEFGLSVGDYEAVLVYSRGEYPLKEGSYIWLDDTEVGYEYNGKEVPVEIDGEMVMMKTPDVSTADYIVLKVPKSLNFQKAILKAVVK